MYNLLVIYIDIDALCEVPQNTIVVTKNNFAGIIMFDVLKIPFTITVKKQPIEIERKVNGRENLKKNLRKYVDTNNLYDEVTKIYLKKKTQRKNNNK